jgi:hypothetical protein
MLPSVQAIFAMNKTFDAAVVDIVGCASSLGDILRFARSVDSTFRFDAEMIGNTLFLIRNAKKETIPDVQGYGHSFLDKFTSYSPEVEETKSHQRIVSYEFGGLECLVRYECDGFDTTLEEGQSDAHLSEQLFGPQQNLEDSIHLDPVGRVVSQESVLEIKTRSQARNPIDLSEHLPRLWVRQIPILVTGYHEFGLFKDVQKSDVTDKVLKWEEDSQKHLLNFALILQRLIIEAKKASHLKLEVYRSGTGSLQLREQWGGPRSVLPGTWKQKWTGKHGLDLDRSVGEDSSDDTDDADYYPMTRGFSRLEDHDDDAALDYTACDPECGYCGRCDY